MFYISFNFFSFFLFSEINSYKFFELTLFSLYYIDMVLTVPFVERFIDITSSSFTEHKNVTATYYDTYVAVTTNQASSTPGFRTSEPVRLLPGSQYQLNVIGYADVGTRAFLWVGDMGRNRAFEEYIELETNDTFVEISKSFVNNFSQLRNIYFGVLFTQPQIGQTFYVQSIELRKYSDEPSNDDTISVGTVVGNGLFLDGNLLRVDSDNFNINSAIIGEILLSNNTITVDTINVASILINTTRTTQELNIGGSISLDTSSYINFGDGIDSTGYGIRDNAGTIQYKNVDGEWQDIGSGGGGLTYWNIDDNLNLYYNDGAIMLGTEVTTPSILNIYDSEPFITLRCNDLTYANGDQASRIYFKNENDETLSYIEGSHNGSSDDDNGMFKIFTRNTVDDNASERICVDSDGLLTIYGSSILSDNTPSLTIKNTSLEDSDDGCVSSFVFRDHSNTILAKIIASQSNTGGIDGKLTFGVNDNGTYDTKLTIDADDTTLVNDGNITLTPTSNLYLNGTNAIFGASTKIGFGTTSKYIEVSGDDLIFNNTDGQIHIKKVNLIANIADVVGVEGETYDYVVQLDDYIIAVDTTLGPVNIQLPASSSVDNGKLLIVSDVGGNTNTYNITITANGSDTILGEATCVIAGAYDAYGLFSIGTKWGVA